MLWLERGENKMAEAAFNSANNAATNFLSSQAEPYEIKVHIEKRIHTLNQIRVNDL